MSHTLFSLHVVAIYPDKVEEDYGYKVPYELDDVLGIVKTYLEYADNATSFVISLVKEKADAARERDVEEKRLREMGQWEFEP